MRLAFLGTSNRARKARIDHENAPAYTRKIKQLTTKLKKEMGKPATTPPEDAMQTLLLGVLSNYASEQRAAAAMEKLLANAVDLNDLRVTPVAEMVETMGVNYPHCRTAAEEIALLLNSIFNRIHDLDLSFLKSVSRKSAMAFLESLDGLSEHASAYLQSRHLGVHMIPLDQHMFAYLQKGDFIAEDATIEQAEKFITSIIKEQDAGDFYNAFKRYAATHSPRRPAAAKPKPKPKSEKPVKEAEASVEKEPTPEVEASPQKKKPTAKTTKKKAETKTTAKTAAKPAAAAKKTAAPKADAKKKTTAKISKPAKKAAKKTTTKKKTAKKKTAKKKTTTKKAGSARPTKTKKKTKTGR